MQDRSLYVAAYDIRDARRLAAALKVLKSYATGGQKSVFECFLTDAERNQLLRRAASVIDGAEDCFFLVRLDPRMKILTRGVAIAPEDPPFYYVG